MTGAEIVRMVLKNIGEDTDDVTYGEYKTQVLGAINEAYLETCAFRYLPRKEAEIAVDGMRILQSALPSDYIRAAAIRDESGNRVDFEEVDGDIRLSRKCDGVTLDYIFRPAAITENSSPILPEEFHCALADYGAFRLMIPGGKQRQARADLFYANYVRAMSRVLPMGDARKFRGQYR